MGSKSKKSISVALIGLLVAFLSFWGAQFAALYTRVTELEQRSYDLQAMKLEADNFIVKLEYELKHKGSRLDVIESYIDHLPLPAWIKRKNPDGSLQMVMINHAYAKKYKISKALYEGAKDYQVWPIDLAEEFKRADEQVLKSKSYVRSIETVIEDGARKEAVVWKFYIQLPQGNAGIGGIVAC